MSTQTRHGAKQILGIHRIQVDTEHFQPLLGIEQGVVEAQMQLARLIGTLEVPEQRHEVAR